MVIFQDRTIGIIGAGSLGEQVIKAIYHRGHKKIIAKRTTEEGLREIAGRYDGIQTTLDNITAARESDIVVIAVKPKLVERVCKEIGKYAGEKLVVSLAAAKKISEIEGYLDNSNTRVARVMTGLFAEDEAAAYTLGGRCNQTDREAITYIFGPNSIEVKEDLLAHRTWIACDTGLTSKSIGISIAELGRLGMNPEYAAVFYAATLEAIAKNLRAGITGEAIFQEVGGTGSFTQGLAEHLSKNGFYKMLEECVVKTVDACLGKK